MFAPQTLDPSDLHSALLNLIQGYRLRTLFLREFSQLTFFCYFNLPQMRSTQFISICWKHLKPCKKKDYVLACPHMIYANLFSFLFNLFFLGGGRDWRWMWRYLLLFFCSSSYPGIFASSHILNVSFTVAAMFVKWLFVSYCLLAWRLGMHCFVSPAHIPLDCILPINLSPV